MGTSTNIEFSQDVSGAIWNPCSAVLTSYTQLLDSPAYTTESDGGEFYRGLYSDTATTIRRVILHLTMDESDMISLLQFRNEVRAGYFNMYLGRIDPFIEGLPDSTHYVRMLDFKQPTRNRLNQYSIQIGIIK